MLQNQGFDLILAWQCLSASPPDLTLVQNELPQQQLAINISADINGTHTMCSKDYNYVLLGKNWSSV